MTTATTTATSVPAATCTTATSTTSTTGTPPAHLARRGRRDASRHQDDARPDAWPASVLGFVGVHCGLRVELGTVADLVHRERTDVARCRAGLLRKVLAEHHRVEDQILWPALVARRPDCAPEMATLVDEHHDLDRSLDALVADPALITEVTGTVLSHLQHEEVAALPIWLDSFTRSDHEWFEVQLRRSTGWRDAATMVSWLLDVTPPEAQGIALARVPTSLKLAHRWWFRRRFDASVRERQHAGWSGQHPALAIAG